MKTGARALGATLRLRYVVLAFCLAPAWGNAAPAVLLDGKSLTFEQVAQVARTGAKVEIAGAARQRVARAHDVVLAAAQADMPIYGLNRGVGAARQVAVLDGQRENVSEVRKSSETFNRNLLISHSRATGPATPVPIVRAAMVARLNTALTGSSGMQASIADMYAAMLNADITPVVPSYASVGEADIFLLSYTGLAMKGEGEVFVGGRRMPAAQALRHAGLTPVQPFAKDALAIMSSNAYSAGQAALLAYDLERLLDQADLVFAASLEALNGNVAPLLADSLAARPYAGNTETANRVASLLKGSYLWNKDAARISQDPLSFRTTPQVHGAIREQLKVLSEHLHIQLNSSDDNPTIVVDADKPAGASEQEARYYVSGSVNNVAVHGAVIPTAHFEPIVWTLDLEALGIGLSHLTNQSMQRANRLSTKEFTGIELLDGEAAGSLSGFWKTANVIQSRVFAESMPMSTQVLPSAKDIEDTGTNAPFVVERVARIGELAYRMLAVELAMAAQVTERRVQQTPQLVLATQTRALMQRARKPVAPAPTVMLPGSSIDAAYEVLRCASANFRDPALTANCHDRAG